MRLPFFSKAAWLAVICGLVIAVSVFAAPASLAGSPLGPNVSYDLKGDFSNSGSAPTSFTSSDTSAGTGGAWRFYASGAGESALRAYCYGSGNSCYGSTVEGEKYGLYAQADNNTGTSIGILGISFGVGGQGVAGINNQNYGYAGVFTATGYSSVGIMASSVSSYGVLGESAQGTALYGLSGVFGVTPGPSFSVFGDTFNGSSTIGVGGNADLGSAVYGQTKGSSASMNSVTAGISGKNLTYNGGAALLNAGAYGTCDSCTGVLGETASYVGVRGRATSPSATNVYGGYFTATAGVGLYGASDSNNGVYGKSDSGYGVIGVSSSNYGMRAASTNSYGLLASSDSSVGVRGTSDTYYGFYAGSTSGTGGYAYTASGQAAFRAHNNTPNVAGHYGIISDGDLMVNGDITCTGSCLAAMGVKTSSGEKLMYSAGGTQSKLSDEGSAMLKNGHAVIKIDPLFAQTVSLDSGYQVFVTPHSAATAGLAVINDTAGSFEVVELAQGKGDFKFDWRISALRKGYEKTRMANAPTVAASATEPDLPAFTAPSDKLPAITAPKVQQHGTTASGAAAP